MKLTSESKFFLGIIAGTAFIIIAAVALLSQPAKPIAKDKLITPTTYTTGNKDAAVWLVEFSDFDCSACKIFSPTVEQLITDNKETLLFAHRHFPLPQHLFAVSAAVAVESAGRQDKFWEMWKLLYNEPSLTESSVSTMVKTIQLDEKQFASDSANPAITARIQQDQEFGNSLGITATPTFFLNGVKLEIGTPDALKKAVEEKLKNID